MLRRCGWLLRPDLHQEVLLLHGFGLGCNLVNNIHIASFAEVGNAFDELYHNLIVLVGYCFSFAKLIIAAKHKGKVYAGEKMSVRQKKGGIPFTIPRPLPFKR